MIMQTQAKNERRRMMSDQIETCVVPLRDVVVYPYMVVPLFVGRPRSIKALEATMAGNKEVFLVAQKEPKNEEPLTSDLYQIGCLATILQILKLPDGTIKVLVEGRTRGKVIDYIQTDPYLSATIELFSDSDEVIDEEEGVVRSLLSQFEQYAEFNKKIPPEMLGALSSIGDLGRLIDTIAAHMPLKIAQKQAILERLSLTHRVDAMMVLLEAEIDVLQVQKKIRGKVKDRMEKNHRDYYLNEQMKVIQEELNADEGGSGTNELAQLETKIKAAQMSAEAKEKAMAELTKLKQMPAMSAEATVARSYIDWLINVPWKKKSKLQQDLTKAQDVLDQDHYGLEKVKERITEYLAVGQRVKKQKGPILCLVGPPGVGKTSLGQSIANATGREFVRISLGGVHDEAEIRGHRRTYIGALPGKIIQKMAKTKVRNPLFLLDEIDKMSTDFRGDPASALLEVLDPEQNNTFNDHYLEVDYDLSDVMFIATSNTLNIPPALLDRMEVIRLAGYTEDEKLNIAMRYLIPKQMEQNGLKKAEINITDKAVKSIIRYYTREAGVRHLEREIAKLCRKVVKLVLTTKKKTKTQINDKNLEDYLGVKRFRFGLAEEDDRIGQVNGLAWTEVGGELLTIEAAVMPGKGKISRTGKLGDVMQESIQAAMTVVRSRSQSLGIAADFYEKSDLHIHVPEGGTPKDGPSAGIGMCIAIVSALTQIPVRADVAMTGEITLRGEVLPIGGLKEKLLAAARGGIKIVIIPHENASDLKEIPKNITEHLEIRPVRWIDEVLQIALSSMPMPLLKSDADLAPGLLAMTNKSDDRLSKH
jgi:ATP-dependent Lon protease